MTDLHGSALPDGGPVKDEELEQPPLSVLQMTVAGVLGAAAAGAGAIAVFKTENEVGSAALMTIGVYFLIAVINRGFPRFKIGDNEIDPKARAIARQADRKASAAVEDAADTKDFVRAATAGSPGITEVDPVAQAVDPEIATLAAEYRTLRWTMSSGPSRTRKMTEIAERMVARFRQMEPQPEEAEARALLTGDDDGLRLAGAAAAYAHPNVEDVPTLVGVIAGTNKPFNEYWALRALERAVDGHCEALTEDARERLRRKLQSVSGADRASQIRRILERCP